MGIIGSQINDRAGHFRCGRAIFIAGELLRTNKRADRHMPVKAEIVGEGLVIRRRRFPQVATLDDERRRVVAQTASGRRRTSRKYVKWSTDFPSIVVIN